MFEKSFEFYDQRLLDLAKGGEDNVCDFFSLLALCHTVMPEEKESSLAYCASLHVLQLFFC
jgi:phospholipid-translocating ATPase